MELNSAAVIGLGFLTLYLVGPHIGDQLMGLMRHTMAHAPATVSMDPTLSTVIGDNMLRFFAVLAPIFAVMTVVAIGANVAQVGFMITPKALEPKFDKLNLVSGFKRLFSAKSLVQLVRDSLKLIVIGLVAYLSIKSEFASFFLLPDQSMSQFAAAMGKLALVLSLRLGLVILVLAILDFLYQRYEFERSIRMSRQELKDEFRDTEGSPQLKTRVRQIQRDMSRRRMMKAVPTADVVITNPTELAVALRYEPLKANAPYVVAKGERLIAQKIKQIAQEHAIPVVENKPLARALFKLCDVGQLIPLNLYRAVAEVLAYVYRLKGKAVS